MNVKKGSFPGWAFCLALASFLSGCKTPDQLDPAAADDTDVAAVHEEASDYVWNSTDVVPITLNGGSITVGGAGATVSGSTVTITSAGTYRISGTLTNGQVIVNTADKEAVRLILNGVTITSATSAPIYIKDSGKTIIGLADNTTNTLTDGATYVYDVPADEEPNAAVFSKSDLTIFGNGALVVNGRFGDGIASKDGLIIKSGAITVNAADDGIRGKDYLIIHDGKLTVTAKADALKSSNDEDPALGYVTINNGTMTISAGDDGIHGESGLTVNDGTVTIAQSYEGLESKVITINGGTIRLTASDDGINAADGSDSGGMPGGQTTASGNLLTITGGRVYVDANGDGLDANGSIIMTGGVVLVNGPSGSGNGALDYDATFTIGGGLLMAVGSSGMAQVPGTTSTQNSVLIGLTAAQTAGTLVRIQASDGKNILTFKPTKRYQSIAFSSPELINGSAYEVYLGGSTTGTPTDGLYADGTYTAGIKASAFTVSSVVTKVNTR
ncbi:carbohydrate-binding domain-containing protein [Spirosoma rigui]|uniref:carbohydrate-binding domain-containing protein n=1 Tax=Spirosoma rigui TaxID=564064 RepID=UPI0009AFB343|nr:carbohydrate-binding domain-containing protein [Spirosoma rigui]